uniref:Uncharacterized protein n=1 Tax=Kwoniella pini CBS 10737 TaxID=1296096 RepID=A0A1B9ICE9_9TREE|nr:uncharacterized protein I206_00497 [Kwoniella pini CBS 10737]OCF53196.1 hypothetical protein I206_00497 [Kwoniella pini CBS 10737]
MREAASILMDIGSSYAADKQTNHHHHRPRRPSAIISSIQHRPAWIFNPSPSPTLPVPTPIIPRPIVNARLSISVAELLNPAPLSPKIDNDGQRKAEVPQYIAYQPLKMKGCCP